MTEFFAVQCHECHSVVGLFRRDEWPKAMGSVVTLCQACLVIEEAEQITREAATC